MIKKIVLAGFSLVCVACVGAIAFILYDAAFQASGSKAQGYGISAVFLMLVLFGGRYLWQSRHS